MYPLIIGSCGVGFLLIAFIINLIGKISEEHPIYLLLNFLGAFMAAYYALEGRVIPFVILELVWGITALVRLVLVIKKSSQND